MLDIYLSPYRHWNQWPIRARGMGSPRCRNSIIRSIINTDCFMYQASHNCLVEQIRCTSANCGMKAWIWLGVSCLWRRLHDRGCWGSAAFMSHGWHSLRLRGLSPQALTLLGSARFIALCLRRHFLECQQGSRHFGECQTCMDYGSAPRSTLKKFLCCTHPFGGACHIYHRNWLVVCHCAAWHNSIPTCSCYSKIHQISSDSPT